MKLITMELVTDFDFVVKSEVIADCLVGFIKEVNEACRLDFLVIMRVSAVD